MNIHDLSTEANLPKRRSRQSKLKTEPLEIPIFKHQIKAKTSRDISTKSCSKKRSRSVPNHLNRISHANLKDWGLLHLKSDFEKEIHMPALLEGTNINAGLRAKMHDWIIEVLSAFGLIDETYFLTTALFDTFIFKSDTVDKRDVHLIGITCMYIASKHEDIRPLFMK